MTVLLYVLLAAAGCFALATGFLFSLHWLVGPLLRLVLSTRYRLVVVGEENVPRRGAVLIALNHLSWFDGLFIAATCPRRGNALVGASYIDVPILRRWARWIGLVPVPFTGPRAQRILIETCRKLLDDGEVLGIFPEAQISRNGLTGPFHRGLEVMIAGRDHVVVIPAFLDNVWGSYASFSGGQFFRKQPRGPRRTIIIAFGSAVSPPITAFSVRQAVLEAGVTAFENRGFSTPPLETIDPALPHLDHPELGPLTGSTANIEGGGVHQTGHKSGSVGHPLPGVALRVADDSGAILPAETPGRLFARVAGRPGWHDTGWTGAIDRDGFVRIVRG